MSPIELQLISHQTKSGLPYQHLHIHIASLDGLIEPTDLKGLSLPEGLIWSQGVVIEGKAPIWLYGFLVHACHPSAWVACFDPRLGESAPTSGGAVVVSTHSRVVEVGQVLVLDLPEAVFSKR
jgi:CRISPR-associated protein Csx3